MPNFITKGKFGPNAIPAHLTTLSVSWLNGQFKAVAIERGAAQASWERPGEVEEAEPFEALIREAVARTNYRGQTVSLLLAHPRLVQQLVDLPPVKGPAVQKIIRRQAQQQKLFPGEAAWACQTSLSAKAGQRVILHLFPKAMLDRFVQGCQRNGLDLVAVVPVSAVLHRQLTQLPLEKEEVAMLAAETGGSTTVVVGRTDGQLLLVRTLSSNWNESVERLAVDLNRTILFLSQQYGASVNEGVCLFGSGAREHAQALQGQMQLPVTVSPVEYQSTYWATDALKLPPRGTPNFLSAVLQKAPQRRAYARVVGAGVVVLLLAAVLASIFSLWAARQETGNLERLRKSVVHLEARREQLQRRSADLAQQQQLINLVLERRPSPIPVWFLGYLSDVVPPQLVVTNLHLQRTDDSWKLLMGTVWQGATLTLAMGGFEITNAVAHLRADLASGPFHVAPDKTVEKEAPVRGGPAATNSFLIEGVVR